MQPRHRARARFLGLALLVSSSPALAQEAPPSFEVARRLDTGWVSNAGRDEAVVISFPVQVAGASWLRLAFSEIVLPEDGAVLRVTVVEEGAQQRMTARHAREWGFTTAYFNGSDVQVEVVAQAGAGPCRLVLESVTAGLPPLPSFTQCGTTDDRVLSFDPRAARVLPVGCTVWLIDDCRHNFLTAGHCSSTSLQTVQFNVPLSNSNGSLNHPPPEDQYPVDVASKQSQNGGVGNDWGHFSTFANSNTGLRPYQKQQASYVRAPAAPVFSPSVTIRITGYGTDSTPSTSNQVQQTSTGPYFSHTGTTIRYLTDTQGGNSGSGVLWEQQNLAIGIHTHGGCNSGQTQGNAGTAIQHVGLQAAMASPLASAVCVGEAHDYCTGKVNSQGCMETISHTGTPSFGGTGSFSINASQIINNKTGMLLYGYAVGSTPWQGGTLCASGTLKRTPAQNSGGNAGPDDCSGTFSFDMTAYILSGVDPALVQGKTVFAQYWSRDPASSPFPAGVTNAVQFSIGP